MIRSPSHRLGKLSQLIGWHAGDTATAMARTSGGRTGSLFTWALVEMYGEEATGFIISESSSKILPPERIQASMIQMGQVAATLSKKLRVLGFGNHLAFHVTRIREVYFNAGLDIAPSLLDNITTETMIDFLRALTYIEHCVKRIQCCFSRAQVQRGNLFLWLWHCVPRTH